MSVSDSFFLDTNIFIYCFDTSAPEKMHAANELVENALSTGLGTISFQVIQEFLNVALQKFEVPLTTEDAVTYLHTILEPLCKIYPTIELYEKGCMVKRETGYSFYDSLILAAADQARTSIMYSEDFQHDFTFGSVTVKNPFIAAS
jgi:predicted nucleic acid-binding protein